MGTIKTTANVADIDKIAGFSALDLSNEQIKSAIKKSDDITADAAALDFAVASTLPNGYNVANPDQLLPSKWGATPHSSVSSTGHVTIAASGGSQSKITIANNVVEGEKYIAFIYIDNPELLTNIGNSVRFYNYSQALFTASLEKSNFNYVVFTASATGIIQLLFNANTSDIDSGTKLCTFDTTAIAIAEWSQSFEDTCAKAKVEYNGGRLTFNRGFEVFSKKSILPENSFIKVSSKSNKCTDIFDTNISNWNSFYHAETHYAYADKGNFLCGGTIDYGKYSDPRLWCGFDIKPINYADSDKTYVVIMEGTLTANNIRNIGFFGNSSAIAQDLEDDVPRKFKVMLEKTFIKGTSDNSQYVHTKQSRKDTSKDTCSLQMVFTTFSIFEKKEGFTIDDYIEASISDVILPKYLPKGAATEGYVNNTINDLHLKSPLDPNDFKVHTDIEMFLSGGQSLNVGSGAASSSDDFKNTLTFALGSSLYTRPFSTEDEKNSFFGTEFKTINGNSVNEMYPPLTNSINSLLHLSKSENGIAVSTFGYQMLPLTWGVSGSSITTMNKGTQPYADMLDCVSKAKEFANKEGKTFSVPAMSWYHGEADRSQEKQWYYDKMSQLFIDIDTDVKAITGQTNTIEFFSYQTSPWIGRDLGGGEMTQMNIQEAQVQVAANYDNVHIAGAMYQFDYGTDYYHPLDRAVISIQTGVAMKRVLNDGKNWIDFKPVSHEVTTDGSNFYTRVKFDLPVKPMRFDTSGDIWHNPRGKQPNFGFELLSDGVEKQTKEPFIVKGDTVVITSAEDPSGMILRYAVNGHAGGGNLCDSQNITIRNKNTDYVIDNFAVGFSEYTI